MSRVLPANVVKYVFQNHSRISVIHKIFKLPSHVARYFDVGKIVVTAKIVESNVASRQIIAPVQAQTESVVDVFKPLP